MIFGLNTVGKENVISDHPLGSVMAVRELGENPVLVIIDVQEGWRGYLPGKWNNEDAVLKMQMLIAQWRKKDWRIIHVRHDSVNPRSFLRHDKVGFEFQKEVSPSEGETVITKHVNSAFIGTNLEEILRVNNADPVVICGFVTDHCVSTTARMSGNLGFRTIVVEDACGTYAKKGLDGKEIDAETLHKVNLASINGEFAAVHKAAEFL